MIRMQSKRRSRRNVRRLEKEIRNSAAKIEHLNERLSSESLRAYAEAEVRLYSERMCHTIKAIMPSYNGMREAMMVLSREFARIGKFSDYERDAGMWR